MTVKKGEELPRGAGVPVPQYLLERLVAGDLPPARAEALRRRLALEPNGLARLEDLAASSAQILAETSPARVAHEVRRRLAEPTVSAVAVSPVPTLARAPRWRWVGAPVALAAFSAVLLLAGRHSRRGPGADGPGSADVRDPDRGGDTLKGLRPGLRVYRKAAARVERLNDGDVTHVGDELQLAYVAAGHRFGAVVSVDGSGRVTFHMPRAAGPAAVLRTDGEAALPEAYELDAAPSFERFLFVTGDAPFDAARLADVVRGLAPPPDGTQQTSFTVRKP